MRQFFTLDNAGPLSDPLRVPVTILDDDKASAPAATPALSGQSLLTPLHFGLAPSSLLSSTSMLAGQSSLVHFQSYDVGYSGAFAPHVSSGLTHIPVTPDATPTQAEEVSFIAGVDSTSKIVATSFNTWNNGTDPATYASTSQTAKWGAGAAGTAGGTVTYFFDAASGWTQTEKNVFISGMTLWSDIANIQFAEAASAGAAQISIVRGASGSGAFFNGSFSGSGSPGTVGTTNVWHFTTGTLNLETGAVSFGPVTADPDVAGGHVWGTIVHELGHALGLGHGGAYDGNVTEATQQFSAQDSTLWTIMSYIDPTTASAKYFAEYPVTGTNWGTSPDFFTRSPTTFMPLDVLASQSLYGVSTSTTFSGGQIFGFNCNIADATKPFYDFTVNAHPVITIWDSGANNTLDLSGFSAANNVNLNPGTFSSVNGMVNNVAIAFNTVINTFVGGSGNDTVLANGNGDLITTGAGNDSITGGAGADGVLFGANYTIADSFNGGAGTNDQIGLQGDYSAGVTLSGAQISNVEVVCLLDGFSYNITTTNDLVGNGQTMTFWSVPMGSTFGATINGAAETDGKFVFYLGQGADVVTGGSGNDLFYGEGGQDTLRGNAGADTFAYIAVSNSTSSSFDIIQDFTAGTDKFKLPTAVTGVDAAFSSQGLNSATFDVNMATAVNAARLGANHAVLWTVQAFVSVGGSDPAPQGGILDPQDNEYVGHTFLIVDANGVAGYQAGVDYVFDVTGGTLAGLATSDFTT